MIFQNFGFNRQSVRAAGGGAYNYPSGAFVIYDFGNPSSYGGSGATVTDVSGNGRNGTLVNSPTFSSSNGGIMQFQQASSQYMTYQGYTSNDMSAVVIWKNTTSTFAYYSGWPSDRAAYGLIWTNDIGSSPPNKQFVPIIFNKNNSGNTFSGTYIGPADITVFHQYAVTVDSIDATTTTAKTYLDSGTTNATETKNFDRTGTPSTTNRTIYVNTDFTVQAGRYGNGSMMAYLHYNRVLTATEVSNIYNIFSSRF